jgi:tetratricopeptide (TPR) repeat protein
MAVLVEALSVIARRNRLDAIYPGGSAQYVADCPNSTACADAHLVRIGFMDPSEARAHIERMKRLGFIHLDEDGAAQEVLVIDQVQGPLSPCSWIEVGHVTVDGNSLAVARLAGDESLTLFTPPGWTYAQSLTKSNRFVPQRNATDELKFLRKQDGLYAYFDCHSGQKFFTSAPPSPSQVADLAAVVVLVQAGDIGEAYERTREALRLQPDSPLGWSMAGECLRSLGRDDEAIAAFQKALDLGQQDAATLAALAECHRKKGELGVAEPLYRRAVTASSTPHRHVFLSRLAGILTDAGQHAEAAECLERSLHAFARNVVARLAHENRLDADLIPEPDPLANVSLELAGYAAMYSVAVHSDVEAFAIPTRKSALAEAATREHGGLYWQDRTDPDGRRTRHFLPNYFNAFWRECFFDPQYRMIVWSYGEALKAVGSPEADRYISESQLIHALAPPCAAHESDCR